MGVEILLIISWYKIWNKLQPDGPLDLYICRLYPTSYTKFYYKSDVVTHIPFSVSAHFLMINDSHSLSFFISALVATTIIGNYKQAFNQMKYIVKQYEHLD